MAKPEGLPGLKVQTWGTHSFFSRSDAGRPLQLLRFGGMDARRRLLIFARLPANLDGLAQS